MNVQLGTSSFVHITYISTLKETEEGLMTMTNCLLFALLARMDKHVT